MYVNSAIIIFFIEIMFQITGMLVTYFVLLVQFQPAGDSSSTSHDCAELVMQNITQLLKTWAQNFTVS